MNSAVLLAYFIKQDEGRAAFKVLQRKGYVRAACLSKNSGGEILTEDTFLRRRVFWTTVLAVAGGLATTIMTMLLNLPGQAGGASFSFAPFATGAVMGGLVGLVWYRRKRFGISHNLLKEKAYWVLSGETVLILQAPVTQLKFVIKYLPKINDSPPAVYILHPRRSNPSQEEWCTESPLTTLQLHEHVQQLGAEHRLAFRPAQEGMLINRLAQGRRWIQQICLDISEASNLEQRLPPAAEWLLDNEYILESNARDVLLNLPPRYYRKLPVLANEAYRGLPRIYVLARELAAHTYLRLDEENILACLESYQSRSPLSIAELWAFPQMIRIALIEGIQLLAGRTINELLDRQTADLWANRLIATNRKEPNQLFSLLAELTVTQPAPSHYFASQLFDFLYDEETVRVPVQNWLERTIGMSMRDLIMAEKSCQTTDQIAIGNAFTSLRQLALLDWKDCFERVSLVEQTLRQDPAGIYQQMDFATRDRYRQAIEELHTGSGLSEDVIARRTIDMAALAVPDFVHDGLFCHVGTYLVGEKRGELARTIGSRETARFRILRWIYRHHSLVYFGGSAFVFFALIVMIHLLGLRYQSYAIQLIFTLLLLIPVSQLSLDVVNYLVMRFFPPRSLPKMNFRSSGIPDEFRTLVVVPMMLVDIEEIRAEADKLELRYLANKEANLLFSLFSDYCDAEQDHCDTDAVLLQTAQECIQALNQRYGEERFFLFHRNRKWCAAEQVFMGWERKRGKLEELNDLITGMRHNEAERLVYVGEPEALANVRFVITLDSDTQLPHDTARRMIETLAHPLNRPRFDQAGQIMAGSYTIIQPRVSASLPSASGSLFSRLFSDPVGIDPYTNAVSDVYQDLTGEGSYQGKGIYDVSAFSRTLSGRFPENRLLSHDLLEGAYVRVGLASDIELYDSFPQNYLSYAQRLHRWIRGDWQIAAWVRSQVPEPEGRRGPNPLSLFNRWKIIDNLRRSLLPVFTVALLLASWFIPSGFGWIAAGVVAAQLLFHALIRPVTWATTGFSVKNIPTDKIGHDLLLVLVEAILLPYQAWLASDAIARVLYRRHVSHRRLLEWVSVQTTQSRAQTMVFLSRHGMITLISGLLGYLIVYWIPVSTQVACFWLALWTLSLPTGWLLYHNSQAMRPQYQLSADDLRFVRGIARRTWRYFCDFVTEQTSWLPPDNYQVSHQNKLAMRTSPTNIGLYMTSVVSARAFGYLTTDSVVEILTRTMQTVVMLERHEGHLLNWYDIHTLTPLNPRYVSTVDSGNLLGALWAIEQGLAALQQKPLLDVQIFAGLRDTAAFLHQDAHDKEQIGSALAALDSTLQKGQESTGHTIDIVLLLRGMQREVDDLVEKARTTTTSERSDMAYWAGQLQSQLKSWLDTVDRYFGWVELLEDKTASAGCPEVPPALRLSLQNAPTLNELAQGNVLGFAPLRMFCDQPAAEQSDHRDPILSGLERAIRLAGESTALLEALLQNCRELSASINMRFLYNSDRRLFSIGFNVSEGRLDRSFYDLLASEVRLGSFVAIARGDIPAQHWFAMSRPYGVIGRYRALLSWTGTMFEYLMPLLYQRSYANTLLDKAARDAVAIQIAYGRKHQIPWGISESAFADLDHNKTYQYYAFGVPELGLKRGLPEKIVVSPYSTLLALSIAPSEALQNLKHLEKLKLLSDYGYYEAVDYSRQSDRESKRGVFVRAFMAHHQGMSFLALTNFLFHDCIRDQFHADLRVRAFEPLLYERIPQLPPLHQIPALERISSAGDNAETVASESRFDTPHTATPKTLLLCNGSFRLMLTNSGGGYSHWGEFAITRWRADSTSDSWGEFCYIHDVESNQLWCNTYQPTGGRVAPYSVTFTLDRALFRRTDHEIESKTEIVVASEDDVEIRRLTLTNRSDRIRRLDLTSYVELVLAPHTADLKHPAFNKMFVQTQALPEQQTLIAWRRPRSEGETPIFVAHRFTLEQSADNVPGRAMQFETDRLRFIGRGHTLANPMGALHEPGNSQGFVLDPIFSLRQRVTLEPGQQLHLSMVMAAASTRDHAVTLMNKYGEPHAIARSFDFTWASAQLELRLLRIQPDEARRFQQLASYLLYPNAFLRTSPNSISGNHKGQSGLWAYGISGDLPIALVTINEVRDLSLIRQMLQAHTYWRMHGLQADLIILNGGGGGYTQPLQKEIEHLIQSFAANTEVDRPGGIYLRCEDLIPAEDLTLLRAVANVVLIAARGTLAQQLGAGHEMFIPPAALMRKKTTQDISAALPFLELHFFNSLGGFTRDFREYAIYLGPGIHTPAPWVNVIANPTFGTLISETGAGFTWYGNSQRNRLTQWTNDPVLDSPTEAIYLRDEETGQYWSPTASPIREQTPYRARHGAGYTVFEHNSHGIEQELTVFIPTNDQGGDPVKVQRVILRNDSGRARKLSMTYYAEWTIGESREACQMHIVSEWDDELNAVIARNRFNPDYPEHVSFAAISLSATSYTADRAVFLGRNRSANNPAAMERARLARRTGAGLDPCAALQVSFTLASGEAQEITCLLGQVASFDQARTIILSYRDNGVVESALQQTKSWWDRHLTIIEVKTPELAADLMINRWLLYQTLSCRMWARSGLYQSGGAFGFRDQLQDVMALLYAHPQLAREHILLAASRQFLEGDVQHWWHPPGGAGIRSRVSDDLLWLPFVVAQYIRVTGDNGILHEMISFLDAPTLNDEQHESFQTPGHTIERATLFEHCQRALARGQTFSVRGLPLIGTGDWNDGLNLVGANGKGESIWLAWFLIEVMRGMTEMANLFGQPETGQRYQADQDALIKKVEAFAWDGDWYQRATFDDGSPLGSSVNEEAQIDSLPQSWAWLSAAADPVRAGKALESAWSYLVREKEGLVLLFDPPFEQATPSPGYIKGYPPGVRENGGQYTHAAVWLAIAMARHGDGTRTAKILRMLNPIEHARDPDAVWRYGVEPYVVAADVYRLPGRTGQGGWSWYTGSAGWLYRAWVEEVLGLTVRGNTLRIAPVIPGWWDGFQMNYRYGEALYDIQVENPDHCEKGVVTVNMDGQLITDGIIHLNQEAVKHIVMVRMGTLH